MRINAKHGQYTLHPIGSTSRDAWAARYARWVNDEEVTKFLYQGTIPISIEQCKQLYDMLTNDKHVVFDIYDNDKNSVGIVGIHEIYWPSKVGEFRILIGDKSHWGGGLGKACLEQMNHVAFDRLNLHKFWLGFNANHKRAEKAYATSGFQHEAILKKHHYKNGVYNDIVRMCMFREDYDAWVKSLQD